MDPPETVGEFLLETPNGVVEIPLTKVDTVGETHKIPNDLQVLLTSSEDYEPFFTHYSSRTLPNHSRYGAGVNTRQREDIRSFRK